MRAALRGNEVARYREAYGVALKTLTEIMLSETADDEDRIEAAEVLLENEPRGEES